MSSKKTELLITGAGGQVGRELQALAADFPQFHFSFLGSKELDIADQSAVCDYFSKNRTDYCLNCAAYTAVDKAEAEPGLAEKVNVEGAKNLARACAAQGARLLHLSSDYVYHTQRNQPYVETDETDPQGVYARTKLAGDLAALETHPAGTMVLRTSWVYSSFGHNFVKTMLRLGAERSRLSVVFDQIGTPTYARDLAKAMLWILTKVENREAGRELLSGIYHYSNEGVASWYDFAVAIFEIKNLPVSVSPIESAAYPTPAGRPPFSVLNKGKIKAAFGLEIPHWRASLEACLKLL